MIKRILLALHDESKRKVYSELLSLDRDVLVNDSSRGLAGLLDDIMRVRPDGVLMDVNFPTPNGDSFYPIAKTAAHMVELGYNPKNTLFGVTGNEKLAAKVKSAGYNVLSNNFQFPELA